jgi:hypothetical protein
MPESVATEGDVTATPGTSMFTGADSGRWTAGAITYTSYAKLKVGGGQVIHKAECTFRFSGASSSGAAVTGQETVTLTAGSPLLQKGASSVLVHGDSKTGTYGNKLEAASSEKLKTE